MRSAAICTAAWLLLGCVPPGSGSPDASSEALLDGGAPTDDGGLDAALPPDAAVVNAALVDAAISDAAISDAGAPCECPEPPECEVARCDGTECAFEPASDFTPCGTGGERSCIGGACSFGVCGDLFREPGPDPAREGCDDGNLDELGADACSADCNPEVLVISSHAGEEALPGSVSIGADDEGNVLFVWADTEGERAVLRARRYSAAGVPFAADETLELESDVGRGFDAHAAVVGLTRGWAVAWASRDGDSSEEGIRYTVLSPSGPVRAPRVANEYTLGRQADPAAARTATGFLVAWVDESGTMTPLGESRLRQRSFADDGRATDDEAALSAEGASARDVFLASDGAAVLAVWTRDASDPFGSSQIVGQRLLGPTVDTEPFSVTESGGADPEAAFLDTGDAVVVWVTRGDDPRGDVLSRRIAATRSPLIDSVTTLAAEIGVAELAPSVVALPGGEYIATYERGGDVSMAPSVLAVHAGTAPLPPEYSLLTGHLSDGRQADVSLLPTARGRWFAWSDASGSGAAGAHRSFVAFLLPPS